MRRPSRTRRRRGFTMVELLMVVVLIGLISLVAYPALSSFSGRDDDAEVATRVSRMFNKVIDQARRRNRAYVVEFVQQAVGVPQGLMRVRESASPSCMLTTLALTRVLQAVPFGQTVDPNYVGEQRPDVGLFGWLHVAEEPSFDGLALCVSPGGSVSVGFGDDAVPLTGELALRVQRFDGSAGAWAAVQPARTVEITYAGGARMGLFE